jgi:replicative DNA helicase
VDLDFATVGDVIAAAGGMDSFFDPAVASNAIGVGIPNVDDLYPGARPGQLVLVAGRTSMGKSAWLLQWAWNAAQAERTVWYYSLEMTRADLIHRLCAHGADIDLGEIVKGRLGHPERQRIAALIHGDAQGRILIADTPEVTTATIGVHLARAKTKPELVIVDYLQLLCINPRANRYEQVSEISRSLKCLAVEHGVPIIAGSQLSRPETGKDDAAPRLSDLRDSGSLEQDADVVCFLHGKQADKLQPLRPVEYLVAKHRQGRLGKVALTFEGARQRFFDPTDHAHTGQAALIHNDAVSGD